MTCWHYVRLSGDSIRIITVPDQQKLLIRVKIVPFHVLTASVSCRQIHLLQIQEKNVKCTLRDGIKSHAFLY
jgi:hypothetical protein